MKDDNQSAKDEETSVGLTIYKSEGEIFQRLHLCKYLSELPELSEDRTCENGDSRHVVRARPEHSSPDNDGVGSECSSRKESR